MLIFLTLTQKCQLSCKYCGSSENYDIEDLSPHPMEIAYDLSLLEKFQKEEDLIICLYGGEPLLKMRIFKKIFAILPNAKYVLQTNAILLNKLKNNDLHKMDTILVSVDGDEKTTDFNRGEGTYSKVIKNVNVIREKEFQGDVIARMTVSKICDIYKSVQHLIGLGIFDHVHWQLDVLWDSDMNSRYGDFIKWRDEEYNPGITKLAEWFAEELKKGKVPGIVPFQGLLKSFLRDEKVTRIRCGAGSTSFNVTTGGLINVCPVAPEVDPICEIGEKDFTPKKLKDQDLIGGLCDECEVRQECGGRCLYANKTMWWEEEGFKEVCVTVKHLIKVVHDIIEPVAKEMIEKEVLSLKDFLYPFYNNTCEIIP
ncbi:radical sam domain containing protein [Anaeramoeba flamelloides]|uniref:Radical sam domain containing protein n=1 Tax=Anaeramoeba flamelloides TaxID=1746091 RepID=A0AAV8A196_9EUKA|nr:radical sam domain containing protein [Anaeramoeba flamelloides]